MQPVAFTYDQRTTGWTGRVRGAYTTLLNEPIYLHGIHLGKLTLETAPVPSATRRSELNRSSGAILVGVSGREICDREEEVVLRAVVLVSSPMHGHVSFGISAKSHMQHRRPD
jgi:hypothetical protein